MNTLTINDSTKPTNLDEKSIFQSARFEKGTRYYTVILDKDLFDDWVIIIANGRIGTKLGRIRTIAFPCFVDACDKFQVTIKNRAKRGYFLESYRNRVLTTFDAFSLNI